MKHPTDAKNARFGLRDDHGRLELVTPEGVPLPFRVAELGHRVLAFLLDALIIALVLAMLGVAAAMTMHEGALALVLLLSFLLVNFYFMFFEQRFEGQTPGKRVQRLRVVDAAGGQLSVEAVIVRNLTRYAEVILPLTVLLAPGTVWPDAPPWHGFLLGGWMLAFGAVPLLNAGRRRLGDFAAGTVVIRAPNTELLADLVASAVVQKPAVMPAAADVPLVFTDEQLSHYGIYELQVLEEVLRRPQDYGDRDGLRQVRTKIQTKIGGPETTADDLKFLQAFYAAQRAHLEQRLRLGDRREDKFDTDDGSQSKTDVS